MPKPKEFNTRESSIMLKILLRLSLKRDISWVKYL